MTVERGAVDPLMLTVSRRFSCAGHGVESNQILWLPRPLMTLIGIVRRPNE
jgi:hypothetical protein